MSVFVPIIAASASLATALGPSDVFGLWRTQDGNAHVRLPSCDRGDCAEVTWVDPEADEAQRIAEGFRVSGNFHREGNGWTGGEVYFPTKKNSYSVTFSLKSRDRLAVQGCRAIFCRTRIWKRIGA